MLAALALGIGTGLLLSHNGVVGGWALPLAQTAGGLWLDALRMSVLPLIFVMTVTGVGNTLTTASAGSLAMRTLMLFAGLLLAAALVGVLLMGLILAIAPVPPVASGAWHVSPPEMVVTTDWLRGFIPANPFAAAASGAVAPLVIFGLLFGLAATRIQPALRAPLLIVFEGVLQTLLVIVGWVLAAAPLGVAALAMAAAARIGLATVSTLVHYVVTASLFCGVLVALLLPVASLGSGIAMRRFARAVAPAQLVAFSTQSSIATLPAMIASLASLGGSGGAEQAVLPLAVALFRLGSAASCGAIALYAATMSGLHPGLAQIMVAAGLSAAVSVAAIGLPSQASFVTVVGPICLAIGVPLEGLVLLMAVDFLPDAVRTVVNVTGDVAVALIADRRFGGELAKSGEERACGHHIGGGETLAEPVEH